MIKVRFDQFIKLQRGFDLPESEIVSGPYPVVTSTSINGYHDTCKVSPPVVVTGRSGSLGVVQYIDEECWPLNTTLYVKDYKGNYPKYVYYYLKTLHLERFNAGAGVPTLNQNHLHSLKIQIHDLEQQRVIGDLLYNYDDLIENNLARISLLEKMASDLHKEWFIRRKRDDWKTIKLSEFGYSVESGSRPKGGIDDTLDEGIPSLGAESINSLGVFDYTNVKYIPHEFYSKMKRGHGRDNDILLYKDGAYIGKVTLFRNNFPFENYAVNEHVYLLRCLNPIYQNYLYFTLKLPQYFTFMQIINRNAAQPGLTQQDLDIIKLTLPDEDTINRFNDLITPILDQIFTLAKENLLLTKQRDLLLPRLMSGKLSVELLLSETA